MNILGSTLVVSDLHLGLGTDKDRERKIISKIIEISKDYDNLVINGDLFETWKYKRCVWKPVKRSLKINRLLKRHPDLHELLLQPNVYYIYGNHDHCVKYRPNDFPVFKQLTVDRDILIIHGNDADEKYSEKTLDKGDDSLLSNFIITFDWLTSAVLRLLKIDRVKASDKMTDFVFTHSDMTNLYIKYAEKLGFKKVILGHTHRPIKFMDNGFTYINCGCCMENIEGVEIINGNIKSIKINL